jgi:hypothetical protein
MAGKNLIHSACSPAPGHYDAPTEEGCPQRFAVGARMSRDDNFPRHRFEGLRFDGDLESHSNQSGFLTEPHGMRAYGVVVEATTPPTSDFRELDRMTGAVRLHKAPLLHS